MDLLTQLHMCGMQGSQNALDSYKILPFSYDSGVHTFQQNRGAEYTPLAGQVRPGESLWR